MASNTPLSLDEIISTLKNTNLPTIIVEGKDDMVVYRNLEDRLSPLEISILPVSGRETVLNIFTRRSELPKNIKFLFIADQDTWIIRGIPTEYNDNSIILTNGYSIENDIFNDGKLIQLLRKDETEKFNSEIEKFTYWYALALSRHINDPTISIAHHPDHVLDTDRYLGMLALAPEENYPEEFREEIFNNYPTLLRGKSLLQLLLRNINYKGRTPKHSMGSLLEIVAVRPGELLTGIFEKSKEYFHET